MQSDDYIAAQGKLGTIEWAFVSVNVKPQAYQFFYSLSDRDQAKVLALFQRLANFWHIGNGEKFHHLGERAGPKGQHLWEFKSFQIRFIGAYKPGHRFIVAYGLRKKANKLRAADIQVTISILEKYDALKGGKP